MKKTLVLATILMVAFMFFGFSDVYAKGKTVIAEPIVVDSLDFEVKECDSTGSMTFDLWAGQYIYAGTVTVTFVDGELFVQVNAVQEEFELHIGTYSTLPTSRPAPGQMTFQNEGWEIGNQLILIIHVAFEYGVEGSNVAGETAYAGTPFTGRGSWFNYVAIRFIEVPCDEENPQEPILTDETAWAFGDFEISSSRWGWYNYIQEGEYTFEIWAAAGNNNTENGYLVGYVTVVYNEEGITLFYNMLSGYTIVEQHEYAGYTVPVHQGLGNYMIADDLEGWIYIAIHLVVEGEFN
jgi:hypothetical protein